ncbi:hypothetical protein CBSLWZGG_CDS53 [Pseudomonas phage PseuPha1]|nr:hypothetical protein CBSLWZGG_CDS53 [Pseudomonas phage PseuPha1]
MSAYSQYQSYRFALAILPVQAELAIVCTTPIPSQK